MKINITKLFRNENFINALIALGDDFPLPTKYLVVHGELGELQRNCCCTVVKFWTHLGVRNYKPVLDGYVEIFNQHQTEDGWLLKLLSTDLALIHPTLEKDLEKLVFWAKMKH